MVELSSHGHEMRPSTDFCHRMGWGRVAGVCCSWEALAPYRSHHRQHPPMGCACAGLCCVPWHWWHVLSHGTGVQSNASASTHFISCFGLMGNADALCYHKKHWIYSFDRFLASEVMRDLKCLLWATKGWGFLFILHFFCMAVAVFSWIQCSSKVKQTLLSYCFD